jgi:hypothetical protein
MCDYSLEFYATRQAQDNEVYVTTRFPSGSMGFAAPGDCTTAVCVSYGTRMTLENLPPELQQDLGVGPIESVVFGVGVLGAMASDTPLPQRKAAPVERIPVEPAE